MSRAGLIRYETLPVLAMFLAAGLLPGVVRAQEMAPVQGPVQSASSGAGSGSMTQNREQGGDEDEVNPEKLAEEFRLNPGTGFEGPTQEPAGNQAMGTMGADARAIARWNVVPFQTLTDRPMFVGVVAFHMNGIDRVEFSLNGGPWVAVREMNRNPQSNTWEYWASIRPQDLRDGTFEVRAIAYPRIGVPRVLETLVLNNNRGGSLPSAVRFASPTGNDETATGTRESPFKTIHAAFRHVQRQQGSVDGATVYLLPGDYSWGPSVRPSIVTNTRWATIEPAPGVNREQVRIAATGRGGMSTKLIRANNVTIWGDSDEGAFLSQNSQLAEDYLWLSNVDMVGRGRSVSRKATVMPQQWTGMFVTDSTVRDMRNAIIGATLQRNVHVRNITADAFTNTMLVVNCSVDDIDPTGTRDHGDVYQFHGSDNERDNVIVYGLRATNVRVQGIFAGDLDMIRNVAFVNVLIERSGRPGSPPFSHWWVPSDHLLLWNVTLVNQPFRMGRTNFRNLSVRGCVFDRWYSSRFIEQSDFERNAVIEDNHFVVSRGFAVITPGRGASTGDPRFRNAAADDFVPQADSPLRRRMNSQVPIDSNGRRRQSVATVGAYE